VLSKTELHARTEVLLEGYAKQVNVEAQTALLIARRQILPAAVRQARFLAEATDDLREAGAAPKSLPKQLKEACRLIDALEAGITTLDAATAKAAAVEKADKRALAFRDKVLPGLLALRESADALEPVVDAAHWPLPTYAEMLFVR
jgi:glutamine synthetase